MIARFVARYRGSLGQLVKFCLVGASGVLINFLVLFAANKIAPLIWDSAHANGVWWHIPIPGTDYNIRWFSIYSMLAFIIANVSNFQINRSWSFKSEHHKSWLKEFVPFFIIGLAAQCLGMLLEIALMKPESPIFLPSSIFDNSTGFRTRLYWAHLIMIIVITPISFLANKYWTFRSIRRPSATGAEPIEPIEQPEI